MNWWNSVKQGWNKSGHIQGDALESFLGSGGPFWRASGTPRWSCLTCKAVPMHHLRCALTCSLVPDCSTKKAVLGPFGPCLAIYLAKMTGTRVEPIGTSQSLPKKAKNIIGCHGKPTSKKPPSLGHVNNLPIYKLGQNIDEKAQFLDFES